MIIELHFALSQDETNKVAKFQNSDEKEDYVTAEFRNPYCRQLYFEFCSAKTREERKECAIRLDNARWAFYKKWAEKKKPKKKLQVVPPDDKFPA